MKRCPPSIHRVALLLLAFGWPLPHRDAPAAEPRHDWENPTLSGVNKEPPHAVRFVYPDAASALTGDPEKSTVAEQYFYDYSEPGESGNKADVRWAALANREGAGLLAVGLPTLSVSALPHATDDLEGPKHSHEIPRRAFVTLNLDWKQMGVGGDNSWGAQPHPQYRIPPRPCSYRFRLRPFAAGEDPPAELAKLDVPETP